MVYLIEFRFHGYAKKYAKNIIYDVSRKFHIRGITRQRAIPHITLFGPFQTRYEKKLISEVFSLGQNYNLVPFRIKGFNFFNSNQNKVIFFDIEPSQELKKLRWNIAQRLSKIAYNQPPFDAKKDFEFHSTIAFKDIDHKFDKIWNYIQNIQEPNINQHLLRITIIKNDLILYEYDLLQKRLLNRHQALNKFYYDKSIELLRQKTLDFKYDLEEKESIFDKINDFLKWMIKP